ncbi:MAG: Gx transporter family protein [Spirochaetaceae bacterium]|jgi:heptaprenyl diphosphate synthase|nr:Gx transporter family protein [Spirochaetaceae bacterium]
MSSPGNDAAAGEQRRNAALLGAFCLFLSTIEYLIPKPLPFMRLGIANLPIMLAIDIFPLATLLLVTAIKILGQALITGTLFSYVFLFSAAGTLLSALSMFGLRRFCRGRLGFAGTSVAGAMVSNLSQLALARFFVFGRSVRYIAPPLLAMGLVSGAALGLFCEYFSRRSRWYAEHSLFKGPPGGPSGESRER